MPTGDRTFAARLRETVESNRVAVEELRAASGAGDWNPAEDPDTWMDYFTQPGYVRNKDANELWIEIWKWIIYSVTEMLENVHKIGKRKYANMMKYP